MKLCAILFIVFVPLAGMKRVPTWDEYDFEKARREVRKSVPKKKERNESNPRSERPLKQVQAKELSRTPI